MILITFTDVIKMTHDCLISFYGFTITTKALKKYFGVTIDRNIGVLTMNKLESEIAKQFDDTVKIYIIPHDSTDNFEYNVSTSSDENSDVEKGFCIGACLYEIDITYATTHQQTVERLTKNLEKSKMLMEKIDKWLPHFRKIVKDDDLELCTHNHFLDCACCS